MPRRHPPAVAAKTAKAIRAAYEGGVVPLATIYETFGISQGQLYMLRNAEGWTPRGTNHKGEPKPKAPKIRNYRKPPKPSGFDAAALARQAREEDERRQRELYGPALEDVRFLRACGFPVNRDGADIRYGNRLVTTAELRRIADRERRLQRPEPALAAAARQARVGRT